MIASLLLVRTTAPPVQVAPVPAAAAPAFDKEKSLPPQPRPYILAPTTSESPASSGPSRVLLWALVATIIVAGALVGVYFGVIRKSQVSRTPPPPTAEKAVK